MTFADPYGIISDIQSRRQAAIASARSPALVRTILGKGPDVSGAKSTCIEIILPTGAKTVFSPVEAIRAPEPERATEEPKPVVVRRRLPPPKLKLAPGIIKAVADAWELDPGDITSGKRSYTYARPRIACYLLLRRAGLSSTVSGRLLGNRDHTTALAGCKKALFLYDTNLAWRSRFDSAVAALSPAPSPRQDGQPAADEAAFLSEPAGSR